MSRILKLFFVVIFILASFGLVLAVGAQEETGPADSSEEVAVWLLPDSPLYFLKTWGEKIRETFTLRTEAKLNYLEKLGEKRAAEAQKMIEKGKPEIAAKIMERYNQRLQNMEQLIEKQGEKLDQKLESVGQRIKNRFEKRNQNLKRVMDKAPDQAKEGLERALDNSNNHLKKLESKFQEKIQKRDLLNERLKDRLQNLNSLEQSDNENKSECGTCPQYVPPAPGWCANGTIVPREKDKCGCQPPPNCT